MKERNSLWISLSWKYWTINKTFIKGIRQIFLLKFTVQLVRKISRRAIRFRDRKLGNLSWMLILVTYFGVRNLQFLRLLMEFLGIWQKLLGGILLEMFDDFLEVRWICELKKHLGKLSLGSWLMVVLSL